MNVKYLIVALVTLSSQTFAASTGSIVGAWTTAEIESESVTRIDIYYTDDGRYFTTTFSENGDVLTQGGYYLAKESQLVFADISNDPDKRVEIPYILDGEILEFTGGTMDMKLKRDTRKSPLTK
jgi:hypothetical protein